jgi:hypothetical protein
VALRFHSRIPRARLELLAPWRALVQALVCLASVFAVAPAQALLPAAPEFQVNSFTPSSQGRPAVAVDPTGQFVVVWESVGSPGTDNSVYSVQGQRYSANGAPLGSQFQVNAYISSNQTDPAIASDPSGNFVVVWTSSGSPGNDNNLTSIQGQRFAASGLPLGSQFQVNTFLASTQQRASVACDAVGNFVVAWESNGSTGTDHSSTSILAQRYAADGTRVGDEFQVNTYTASDQQRPSIAVDAAGNFVVVWTSLGSVGNDLSDTSIQGQRYAAGGSSVGGQFQVNTHVVSTQNKPAVAYDAAGNFVATWESNSSQGSDASFYSVHGRRFSSNGTPLGNQFQANTFTLNNQSSPCIAIDSEGNFIIGWNSVGSLANDQSSTSIQFQRYAADGTLVGGETQVNTFINGLQSFPAATFDPFGRLVVVYESAGSPGTDQSDTSVLGQRFVGNFTISATAGLGGSITPGGPISVSSGSNQSFTIAPDSCYGVADVLVDGVSVGAVTNYTFNDVMASHTIEASFALDSFAITASAGAGGSISPLGAVAVNCGADQAFTIAPDACYRVADVLVDGASVGAVTNYTFNDVVASHTIEASFALDDFIITASAGIGGSISPMGNIVISCNGNQSFTVTPDSNNVVLNVIVDGISVGPVSFYDFVNVMADHTIHANFRSRRTGGSKVLVAQFLQPQTDASASPGKTTMGNASKVTIGSTVLITWPACDRADAASVDLLLSRAGVNGPFIAIATGIPDVGFSQWTITGPATPSAVLKVVAHDPSAVHCSEDVSSTEFQIADASEGGANDPPVIEFALPAIAPNPARNVVSISFTIPFATRVAVTVLDVRGRQVATLLDGNLEAGRHGVTWNGEGAAGRAAPGVYFIRVERSSDSLVRRVVFLR